MGAHVPRLWRFSLARREWTVRFRSPPQIKKEKMKITVSFVNPKHYNISNIGQWIWYFKKYKFVKGFNIRIFGLHFNIREKNATEKLIFLFKEK